MRSASKGCCGAHIMAGTGKGQGNIFISDEASVSLSQLMFPSFTSCTAHKEACVNVWCSCIGHSFAGCMLRGLCWGHDMDLGRLLGAGRRSTDRFKQSSCRASYCLKFSQHGYTHTLRLAFFKPHPVSCTICISGMRSTAPATGPSSGCSPGLPISGAIARLNIKCCAVQRHVSEPFACLLSRYAAFRDILASQTNSVYILHVVCLPDQN